MARSYDSENSDSDDGSDHGSEHEEPLSKDYVVPNDFQLNLPLLVYLRKLGELSFERYKAADNLDDLKMCIHAMRDASYLILDENPDKPAVLVLFAKALRTRFERLTFSPDLDEAILSLTQAVDLTSNETPEKPSRLLALISALHARFKMTMDLADLGAAVKHGTKVLELTPDDHADRRIRLNSLAVSLQARFERLGKLADLQEAIRLKTIAVDIIPEIHPEKPAQLSNLAISLYLQHLHLKTLPDLVETIALQSRAIESTPDGHPDRTIMLRSLGRFYRTRLTSPYSQDDDLSNARGAFVRAMKEKSGHPDWRLRAGLDYIDLLSDSPSTPPLKSALLQAYEQILCLVPPMIWRNSDMRRRDEEPVDLITLANKAAADAIAVGDNVKALEWIESGRVLVWGQVLQTKTPLDTLQEQHPQLASDFHRVYRELLAVSAPIDPFLQDENHTCESLEAQAERSRELATQYDALVSKIRELEGFENFLRYKKLEQLSGACTSGPVVIINVHHSRCDALVLHHPGEVVHVPLPTFSYDHAMKLRRQLSSVLETTQASGSRFRNGTISKEERLGSVAGSRFGRITRDPMRVILADLWTQVVKPIFDAVCKLPSSAVGDGLPRITWCPTGPLVSLPLHAAGLYSEGTQLSPSIMDLAVSSYTPTLEALIKPRTFALPPKSPNPQPKILVVSQSDTPGYPPIEGAEIEAAIVASIFRKSTDIVEGSAGTVDAVLGAMKTHDWVHFACHSVQDSEHPTGSSFALHDGKLTLSKLMSLSVPHAELAVISTCHAPAANYVDGAHMGTAAHIAVGILQVGYGGVIGSMWPICDDSAPTVASRLYGTMYQQLTRGEFEPARALHEATRALRDEVGVENFTRWASFVHFGS